MEPAPEIHLAGQEEAATCVIWNRMCAAIDSLPEPGRPVRGRYGAVNAVVDVANHAGALRFVPQPCLRAAVTPLLKTAGSGRVGVLLKYC